MSQSVSLHNNLETVSNSGHFKTHPEPDTSTHSLSHNIPPCHYIDEPCGINMSEKLCLQWNDFQENIKSAFGNLREDNDFADVTLACEDGQQVEAHKVILAASSPFFQKLLGRNKHAHPLIYMRGVKFDDVLAIIDFLYRGEANVFQENLDSFLAIAEELQLKGLMGKTDERNQNFEVDEKYLPPKVSPTNTSRQVKEGSIKKPGSKIQNPGQNGTLAIPSNFSGDFEELEERVKSLMEKSENNYANQGRKADRCKGVERKG